MVFCVFFFLFLLLFFFWFLFYVRMNGRLCRRCVEIVENKENVRSWKMMRVIFTQCTVYYVTSEFFVCLGALSTGVSNLFPFLLYSLLLFCRQRCDLLRFSYLFSFLFFFYFLLSSIVCSYFPNAKTNSSHLNVNLSSLCLHFYCSLKQIFLFTFFFLSIVYTIDLHVRARLYGPTKNPKLIHTNTHFSFMLLCNNNNENINNKYKHVRRIVETSKL